VADLIKAISYKQLRPWATGRWPRRRSARRARLRNLTPGYNELLGRRPDIGECREL